MSKERVNLLADDVWNHVFHTLDAEPTTTASQCARVASLIQHIFLSELSSNG